MSIAVIFPMGEIQLDITRQIPRLSDGEAGVLDGVLHMEWLGAADKLPGADEWTDLALNTADPNPFFERWMVAPALAHYSEDKALSLAVLRDGERLLGILPLAARPDYYGRPVRNLQAWLHGNAFCGQPLIRAGYEDAFWTALFETLDRDTQGSVMLHLQRLPAEGATVAALRRVAQAQGRTHGVVKREERALLQSDSDPETYFAQSLSGKKRKELRRQARRLADRGDLQIKRVSKPAAVQTWAEQFLWLEASGWKGRNGSALACDMATAQWFREMLAGAAASGRIECLSLLLNGRPIAMLANFLASPGAFSFKTAFDENYSTSSPGVLLQWENLALLERDDIAWTDSCAASDHPMIDHFWRERHEHLWVNVALGGPARRGIARLWMLVESRGKMQEL